MTQRQIEELVERIGRRDDYYHGGDVELTARVWAKCGFTADSAEPWLDIGVFDPEVAAELRDAGITPAQTVEAARTLVARYGAHRFTSGCPIYATCNCDLSVCWLIDAAR